MIKRHRQRKLQYQILGGDVLRLGFAVSDREFITPELQLYYEGNYYAIGERRLRFQQDKTREQDTLFSPCRHCRGHEAFRSGQRGYYAGGGASIDSYGTQKEAFRRYFAGNVSFVFEGAAYRCRIADCKVFAQGHAALCRYYPRLQEYRSITLVDIGGYTVDVLTVHNFRLTGQAAPLRMGTIILTAAFRCPAEKRHSSSDVLITDAIRGKIQHTTAGKSKSCGAGGVRLLQGAAGTLRNGVWI